jgi:glycosyltransferase involved in cell wall biosynthesis
MKVLIALNSAWNLLNFRSGLIKALQDHGHQVMLAAPADEHVRALEDLGARFVDLPMQVHGTNPLADLGLVLRLLQLIRTETPDVLLAYTAKPNVYGGLAGRCLGVPVINNIAGLGSVFIRGGWLARVLATLYRLALTRSQRVFFQNPDDHRQFIEMGLVRAELCAVLPGSGVDLRRFQPMPLPSLRWRDEVNEESDKGRRFVFLLVARLLKDKGVLEFAEAARLLKPLYPWAEFALLGFQDAQNPNAVPEDQLSSWQAQGWVSYWGSSSDVREQLARADCVVLPSYREGTPRTLLEAAAMGRPLVATDVPGCREVVQHGVNGLLCQPRNASDLAEKMQAVLALSPLSLSQWGIESRRWVEQHFDEQIVIREYLQAIDALA